MEYDFTNLIADLVFQSDPELSSRLEYQEEALREVECREPFVFGRWVDAVDLNYLLSAFALKDEDFAALFPGMAHVTWRERQEFLAALDAHFGRCPHCSLARGYSLEMDARIEKAFQQNSDSLLRILEEDEAGSEAEGAREGSKPKSASAAQG